MFSRFYYTLEISQLTNKLNTLWLNDTTTINSSGLRIGIKRMFFLALFEIIKKGKEFFCRKWESFLLGTEAAKKLPFTLAHKYFLPKLS